MLTNDVSSDIEKLIKTQPVELDLTGENYGGRGEIPRKISAFEKLIRHAISRFSMDRVYDLMRIVTTELRTQKPKQQSVSEENTEPLETKTQRSGETNGDTGSDVGDKNETENETDTKSSPGSDTDNKSVNSDSEGNNIVTSEVTNINENSESKSRNKENATKTVTITSLRQVREVIEELELKESKGEKLTDRQIVALRHYATFSKDVAYLHEAKNYFKENVYCCLLEDFYDPNESPDSRNSQSPPEASKEGNITESNTAGSQSGNNRKNRKLKPSSHPPRQTGKKPEAPKESDRKRIHSVVKDMEDTLRKWSGLLEDGDLIQEYFDDDSHHEVVHYLHCAPFVLVFRVVPDVFIKCYRALDLAREWIKIAERIYKGRLPLGRKLSRAGNEENVNDDVKEDTEDIQKEENNYIEDVSRTYENHMENIKNKIVDVTEVLEQHEKQMSELTKEMEILKARENRVDKLNANFESADNKLQNAQKEFSKYLNERQKTLDEIVDVPSGSFRHSELSKKAEVLDKELTKKKIELNLLEYRKSMLQEDFLLELEIRPNFIHFVGDVQVKMTDIDNDVKEKKSQKIKLEKQLELMTTNTEKVKAVMGVCLGQEPTDSDLEIAVKLGSVQVTSHEDDLETCEMEQPDNRMSGDESERQKKNSEFISEEDAWLESDQSFVSVSDDVDLTDFLPSTVVFGESSSSARKLAGKAMSSRRSPKTKTYIPQTTSQQFSDAINDLKPRSSPTTPKGYLGPKKLKPHSKVYKQMHAAANYNRFS